MDARTMEAAVKMARGISEEHYWYALEEINIEFDCAAEMIIAEGLHGYHLGSLAFSEI